MRMYKLLINCGEKFISSLSLEKAEFNPRRYDGGTQSKEGYDDEETE